MPRLPHSALNRLDALVFKFWCALLCVFLLAAPLPAHAQTDCSAYGQCEALQGTLPFAGLQPPILIAIDEGSLSSMFDTAEERQDFRTRLATAA
jgi:hypothetical protein